MDKLNIICQHVCQSITNMGIEVACIHFLVYFHILSINTRNHLGILHISQQYQTCHVYHCQEIKANMSEIWQRNNVTDYTSEVDRDQNWKSAQKETSYSGSCALMRSQSKSAHNMYSEEMWGRQLELYVSYSIIRLLDLCLSNNINQTVHKKY